MPPGTGSLLEATAAAPRAGATALGAALPGARRPGRAGRAADVHGRPRSRPARPWCARRRTEPGLGWVPYGSARPSSGRRRRPPADAGPTSARPTGRCAARCSTPPTSWPRLDVARWRPEVADELTTCAPASPVAAPPGVPARAADLARRALHLRRGRRPRARRRRRRGHGGRDRGPPRRAGAARARLPGTPSPRPVRRTVGRTRVTGQALASSPTMTTTCRDPADHAHRHGPARRHLRGLRRARARRRRGARHRADRAARPAGPRRPRDRAARREAARRRGREDRAPTSA